ncbi:ketopantoate reductase family protein [Pararcticibacter amylolyticus]|uniref:2-dehydropantoate 2-reductase n=1 Tax=Pararcticibacter amylolyticus TaxID=2173175 RepID=A0A2U2PDP0_9SPHI|nr:2-dehydropantoate 2-reductase [Pararcticibacter amylolyticus]PWG79239.1 2-dehydropantoate 2-reductase [Pararcticibacter amylolyticus]
MIYLIGAGAIGKALAVMLTQSGRQVLLVRSSVDQDADNIENITVRLPDGSTLTSDVTIKTFNTLRNMKGILLVTSKSYGNTSIAGELAAIKPEGPIVLLQNGLDIEQPFIDSGFNSIYRCVLMATSQFIADGTIQFKPVAASLVGVVSGNNEELGEVIAQIDNPWFPFREENPILYVVWKKVIANCVFNSICPLLDIDNGIFYRNADALRLARTIIDECVQVAGKAGISLDSEELEQLVLNISRSSDGQFISTLQDIRNRRQTEIETLNLAVAAQAEMLQAAHLVIATRFLGKMIQLKSKLIL